MLFGKLPSSKTTIISPSGTKLSGELYVLTSHFSLGKPWVLLKEAANLLLLRGPAHTD